MSKEEREAEISRKIEEIKNRNKEIARRHQEIEADRRNADNFSQKAIERMKHKPAEQQIREVQLKPKKDNRKTSHSNVATSSDVVAYRPPRLSEDDLPPPDPVYSFLTDRLREGAFCAPPRSPPSRRRSSTASTTSDLSSGSRRSSVSRKTSTASNSSWTSDSSCGFANYQPPRRFSRCHNYVKNRKVSDGGYFSPTEEIDNELPKLNEKSCDTVNREEQPVLQKDEVNRSDATLSELITDGALRNRPQRKKAIKQEVKEFRSEQVLNWRVRQDDSNLASMTIDQAQIIAVQEIIENMTIQDPNNNQTVLTSSAIAMHPENVPLDMNC